MSKKKLGGYYKVGYCKPPKDTQFKKGQSGNRKGRPKGATNKVTDESVLTLVAREANREVSVNDGTRMLTLPLVIVFIRGLMQKAAKGDLRAIDKTLELLERAEEKGASDQAMVQKAQSEAFDKGLDKLTDEELEVFIKLLEKINSTSPSQSPNPQTRTRGLKKSVNPNRLE